MESDRFDALTTRLSVSLSRRKSLGLLSVLGVTDVASWDNADAADKKKKKRKKKKNKKASGCGSGLTKCQGQCVNLQSDRINCGDCYSECDDTQECRQGLCLPPCSERACFERIIEVDESLYQITTGPDNTLITVTGADNLAVFRKSGELVRSIGEFGLDPGEFDGPNGVAVGPDGAIYASDYGNERIQIFRANGTVDVWPLGQDMEPGELAVTPTGTVYVVIDRQVYRLNTSGTIEYRWGPDGTESSYFESSFGLAIDASGSIFVADTYDDRIYRFSDGGLNNVQVLWSVGASGVDPGEFRYPGGLAIAAGQVFVADTDNYRVQVLNVADGTSLYSWPVTDEYGFPDDPYNLVVVSGQAYLTSGYGGILVYRLT